MSGAFCKPGSFAEALAYMLPSTRADAEVADRPPASTFVFHAYCFASDAEGKWDLSDIPLFWQFAFVWPCMLISPSVAPICNKYSIEGRRTIASVCTLARRAWIHLSGSQEHLACVDPFHARNHLSDLWMQSLEVPLSAHRTELESIQEGFNRLQDCYNVVFRRLLAFLACSSKWLPGTEMSID